MKKAVAVAAFLLCGLIGCAEARGPSQWRSGDGVARVTMPEGWSVITESARADDYPLVIASPSMASRQENCSVLVIAHPRGPLPHDQDMLNRARADLTAEGLFASPDVVRAFSNELINGVRVVSYDVEREGARLMERLFQVSRRGRHTEYVLGCQVAADASADIEASARWLSSLEIHR
jgi:hypothetical protein